MNDTALSIAEFARLSGLSAYTLRYYEARGILRSVQRAPNGHRRYRREDILWIEFVLRLKQTGMPLKEIRRYADLRAQGEATLTERQAMLEGHRQKLDVQMAAMTVSANALDDKIRLYQDMIAQSSAPTRRKAQ